MQKIIKTVFILFTILLLSSCLSRKSITSEDGVDVKLFTRVYAAQKVDSTIAYSMLRDFAVKDYRDWYSDAFPFDYLLFYKKNNDLEMIKVGSINYFYGYVCLWVSLYSPDDDSRKFWFNKSLFYNVSGELLSSPSNMQDNIKKWQDDAKEITADSEIQRINECGFFDVLFLDQPSDNEYIRALKKARRDEAENLINDYKTMHQIGLAREFRINGSVSSSISWSKDI